MSRVVLLLVLIAGRTLLSAEPPPEKAPIPTRESQVEWQKTINEVYRDDFARAVSPEQKAALSRKLLKDAQATTGDPSGRYVLLLMARDMAANAGDTETTFAAIMEASKAYQTDFVEIAAGAWTRLANTVGPADKELFILRGDGIIDAAIAADRYEWAERVAALTLVTAKKTTYAPALLKRTEGRVKEVKEINAAFADYTKSLAQLKQDPGDSTASLSVGRFLCFMKGDWIHGLPILATGSDPALKLLAAREVSGVTTAASQLALADGWWGYAEKAVGIARIQIRRHAVRWYREASPGLSGLSKTKADARAREAENAGDQMWINLLPLVDPKRDALRGKWDSQKGTLIGGKEYHDSIMIPVIPNGDYRFHVGFKRMEGNGDVAFLLPVGASRVCFLLSSYNGKFGGLFEVKGRELPYQQNVQTPSPLDNGRQYTFEIQVKTKDKDAAVEATLDGKPILSWEGPQSDLSSAVYIQPTPPALGLGGLDSTILFNEVRLQMLSGNAERVAPAAGR